jgi:hypothetical protein
MLIKDYTGTTHTTNAQLDAMVAEANIGPDAMDMLVQIQKLIYAFDNLPLLVGKSANANQKRAIAKLKKSKMILVFRNKFHSEVERGVKITAIGHRALILAGKHYNQAYYDTFKKDGAA